MDRELEPGRVDTLVIAGPTAVGKTELTLRLAELEGAEVVVADSRQVYRGLDIGTAKPSDSEQASVRHHLLDSLDLDEISTAGQWHNQFLDVHRESRRRATPLIVTGGSTLYLDSLIEGPPALPNVSAETQQQVSEEYEHTGGPKQLFDELQREDSLSAATLDPTKRHRLIRYVGVLRETGERPSDVLARGRIPSVEVDLVVLFRPRAELYERIDRRVDRMVADGLLDEVEILVCDNAPVLSATIGYQELLPVLEGERTLEDGIRLIKRNSRRYAKRQLTWFRRYPNALWIDARVATPERVLEAMRWPTRT